MFSTILNFLDDARINASFPGFNSAEKQLHLEIARARFSTTELDSRLAIVAADIERTAKEKFDDELDIHRFEQHRLDGVATDAEQKLQYFERDYKSELDTEYQALNELKGLRAECNAEISSAHEDLRQAKENLDAWYSKAEGNWIGNGGKQLPKHAFFGQDLSDRDRYKEQRSEASEQLNSNCSNRAEIDDDICQVKEAIGRIKHDRQIMFDLRREGFEIGFVRDVSKKARENSRRIASDVERLLKQRESFVRETRSAAGVALIEGAIQNIRKQRDQFIREFDSEESLCARKAIHRSKWLAAKGR